MGDMNIKSQRKAAGGFLSWPLVLAGMRKTRPMALIMGIVTWTVSLLIPLKEMLGISNGLTAGPSFRRGFSVLQANPTLCFAFMFYAPLMTLYVFNFLNNRAGSDYYHGTPARRRTVCLSYFLSVTLWTAIILAVAELISAVCAGVWGEYISLENGRLISTFIVMLVCALLVEASVLIAMSVTGTLLTNLVAALLLIFLPQVVFLLIGSTIESLVPMITYESLPAIIRGMLNCVTGLTIGLFFGQGSTTLYSKPAVIYTFVLAIIYLVIGTVLFVHRPSETAGRPAIGEKLQGLIRVIIACLITAPAILTFSSTPANAISMPVTFTKRFFGHLTSEQWVTVIVFYLISLGSMIVYELITAKRMPGWKRFFTGVLCILAVDALWLGIGWGAASHYQKEKVAPEEIESVEVDGDVFSSRLDNAAMASQSWIYDSIHQIVFTDPSVLELIAKRHDETAQGFYPDSDGKITIYARYDYTDWADSVAVRINKKDGTSLKRYLNLKDSDLTELLQAYGETDNAEKLKSLPAVSEISNISVEYPLSNDTSVGSGDPPTSFGMDRSECLEIYDSYQKELQKLSAGEWASILADSASFSDNPYIFIDSKDVNESYRTAALPITDAFPETRKLLGKLGGEEAANALNGVTVTTIGGADGPTSVFIAGKVGDSANGTQIIGSADGPTSIRLAGEDETDAIIEEDNGQAETDSVR